MEAKSGLRWLAGCGYAPGRPRTRRAIRASLSSATIGRDVAAFTWQRAQLSLAWQVAHDSMDFSAAVPCVAMKSGDECDGGFGSAATALSLSATARTSDT